MKKRLIASAIVLASIVITPKFVSNKVAESLHTTIAEINSNPGYMATIQEFKSGWFASTAKIEIGVDLVAMSPQTTEDDYPFPTEGSIVVDFNSSHGPILFGTHSGIGWMAYTVDYSGETARDTLSWADSVPLYSLTSNIGLFGDSKFSDRLTAFNAAEGQAFSIDFSGYHGQGEYTGGEYSYSGTSEKFHFNAAEGNFVATGLKVDMSMLGDMFEALKGKVFDSAINMDLNNITFKDKASEQTFDLNGLAMSSETTVDKAANLVSGVFNYSVNNMAMMDYNTSDFVLQMEMKNLSLEFLESYRLFFKDLVKLQPQEITDKTLDFMQNKLLPALTASPELNITDFHGTIPEGNFKATMFTKLSGIDAMPDDIADPAFWLQHILANANIELDKDVMLLFAQQQLRSQLLQNPEVAAMTPEEVEQIVVQQTPVMLDTLQQQGLMTETDNGYISSFELKEGIALLNGNPIPIPGM
jgi:uncharacterized protein YdgA (DUF945 family)